MHGEKRTGDSVPTSSAVNVSFRYLYVNFESRSKNEHLQLFLAEFKNY
jgi:hypothetical protein